MHTVRAAIPLVAEEFNQTCRCVTLDRPELNRQLGPLDLKLLTERPHLFADAAVFLSRSDFQGQLDVIAAIERAIALPGYRQYAQEHAHLNARHVPKALGVFLGYDFHLHPDGPKLIEINSNAGGALLNAKLMHAQLHCCGKADTQQPGNFISRNAGLSPEQQFIVMFLQEWRLQRGPQAIKTIAIVDQQPERQYLYPEFLLFQALFAAAGLTAIICDPQELSYQNGSLCHGETRIDLVYNRLTDFYLTESQHAALRAAYLDDAVVLTPHPYQYALYADKTNLTLFGNDAFLQQIGVSAADRRILIHGVARTEKVAPEHAERLWAQRKQLFFKPCRGYGGKAAYRGDKLTRGVFNNILQGDYVAQTLVPPTQRQLSVNQRPAELKLDYRHYVYQAQTQLVCARLYQGQTTNFRTEGGGFAQIALIDD